MYDRHLFVPGKRDYVRGKRGRPEVECILCELVARRDSVISLEVHREDGFLVTGNLFPYNPGHVMLVPERHVLDPRELTEDEVLARHRLLSLTLTTLDEVYGPAGYNVGNNVGPASGASVPHWHEHVVPRYANEVGFIDIVGGARVMVESPHETQARLREGFRSVKEQRERG